MKEDQLEDIHNKFHKESTHFTFFKKNKKNKDYIYKSRIDKILIKKVNNNLKITAHETIDNYIESDHKIIMVNISLLTLKPTKLFNVPK